MQMWARARPAADALAALALRGVALGAPDVKRGHGQLPSINDAWTGQSGLTRRRHNVELSMPFSEIASVSQFWSSAEG
jgi:hypothetical protein